MPVRFRATLRPRASRGFCWSVLSSGPAAPAASARTRTAAIDTATAFSMRHPFCRRFGTIRRSSHGRHDAGVDSRVAHHRHAQGHVPGGAGVARRRGRRAAASRAPRLDPERARHAPEDGPRRARQGAGDPCPHLRDRGRGDHNCRRPLDGRRAVRAHDSARRALRVGEHAPGRRDRWARARVLHDRAPLAREGHGPARVAPFDGPLLRASPRHLRRAPRAARGPRRRAPDPRVLPPRPRAARTRGGPRGPGDDLMLAPEDVLRAIAAARGDAICVPTMTTAPAWRTLAPDDPSVTCVGFMGGASSLGLGLALARPDRRVIVFDGDGSLLMQLGSLATIAGAQPRNLTHLVFKNGVYHTSGAQDIPGGLTVDFVLMAKGAGYRNAYAIREATEFKRRLPALLTEEGPVLVELHTGLAEKTPMTDRGGLPFHRQAEALRVKLLRPRA